MSLIINLEIYEVDKNVFLFIILRNLLIEFRVVIAFKYFANQRNNHLVDCYIASHTSLIYCPVGICSSIFMTTIVYLSVSLKWYKHKVRNCFIIF